MVNTVMHTVTITPHTCGQCGCVFGMESEFFQSRRRDGKTFYCPNGHPRAFCETEADRLRKELALEVDAKHRAENRTKWAREEAERERRSKIALKGQLTKVKKRVGNGVCPCCQRSFQNLHNHMKNQHPEYAGG